MVNEQFEKIERGIDKFMLIVVDVFKIGVLLFFITSGTWGFLNIIKSSLE